MELVCRHYNNKDGDKINRYRLYLQVISLYDIVQFDGKQLNPEIKQGGCVSSHQFTVHWVVFPKPPNRDSALWVSFLDTYIE
jgi:hypothetical protein